jgi:hypothetical protein
MVQVYIRWDVPRIGSKGKAKKTSPIWESFNHFDASYYQISFSNVHGMPWEEKIQAAVCWGKRLSNNLEAHLMPHPKEWAHYLNENILCTSSAIEKDGIPAGPKHSS